MSTIAFDQFALTRITDFARSLSRLHQASRRQLIEDDAIDREFNAVCMSVWGYTTDDISDELFTVEAARSVEEAAQLMSVHDFSQISVTKDGRIIGSLNESHLYEEIVRHPGVKKEPVEVIMQPAFPFVDISTPVELLATMITPGNPAVLIRDFKTDKTFIITRSDVIRVLM